MKHQHLSMGVTYRAYKIFGKYILTGSEYLVYMLDLMCYIRPKKNDCLFPLTRPGLFKRAGSFFFFTISKKNNVFFLNPMTSIHLDSERCCQKNKTVLPICNMCEGKGLKAIVARPYGKH